MFPVKLSSILIVTLLLIAIAKTSTRWLGMSLRCPKIQRFLRSIWKKRRLGDMRPKRFLLTEIKSNFSTLTEKVQRNIIQSIYRETGEEKSEVGIDSKDPATIKHL